MGKNLVPALNFYQKGGCSHVTAISKGWYNSGKNLIILGVIDTDMLEEPKIYAIIPAYNEALHIAAVVQQTLRYLPVIVIDDGSKDDTAARAEAAGAEVLVQRPNQGKGIALKRGFEEALSRGAEAVVMLDADGQHDPDEIPAFLERYRETGADLIIGERNYGQMPTVRRMSNTFGRWSFSRALGQYIVDNQSGYRMLSRRMMEKTLEAREPRFEFEIEMIVLGVKAGYRLAGVPIRTIYADETSHIQPLRHTLKWFELLWRTRREMRGR